jgi:hypothetical protein
MNNANCFPASSPLPFYSHILPPLLPIFPSSFFFFFLFHLLHFLILLILSLVRPFLLPVYSLSLIFPLIPFSFVSFLSPFLFCPSLTFSSFLLYFLLFFFFALLSQTTIPMPVDSDHLQPIIQNYLRFISEETPVTCLRASFQHAASQEQWSSTRKEMQLQ